MVSYKTKVIRYFDSKIDNYSAYFFFDPQGYSLNLFLVYNVEVIVFIFCLNHDSFLTLFLQEKCAVHLNVEKPQSKISF